MTILSKTVAELTDAVNAIMHDETICLCNSCEIVTGMTAMTNAVGWGPDVVEDHQFSANANGTYDVTGTLLLCGDQIDDKPFCGDQIKIDFQGTLVKSKTGTWRFRTLDYVNHRNNFSN